MGSLLGSLGLGDVPSDPNDIPDGPYNGEVFKDDYVVKSDDTVHHVLTYRVTDGTHKGAQRQEWFAIGKDPVREGPANKLVGMTPTMADTPKRWYKKRLSDLGLSQEQIDNYQPGMLTGTPIRFGVKTKDGYKNISFAEKTKAPAGHEAAINSGSVQGAL